MSRGHRGLVRPGGRAPEIDASPFPLLSQPAVKVYRATQGVHYGALDRGVGDRLPRVWCADPASTFGSLSFAFVEDPDGNQVELIMTIE